MPHNVRIRLDPQWSTGSLWTTGEQSALDAALVAAVNGDGGGTYSPTANVNIQGAGLRLIATTHSVTGGNSGVLTIPANGAILQHNDNDYCVLAAGHSGASRSLRSSIVASVYPSGWGTISSTSSRVPISPFNLLATVNGAVARTKLRVHNGALLTNVTFRFQVNQSSGAVPTQMPRFGVFAEDAFGNVYPLSLSMPYQHPPAPADNTAWVAGGAVQAFSFVCDTVSSNPRVLIDTSQYTYVAKTIEVSGAGALTAAIVYLDPTVSVNDIHDIRPG